MNTDTVQERTGATEPVSLGKVNWSAGFKDAKGPTGFRIPAQPATEKKP